MTSPGAPGVVAPGWKVCSLSLFFSVYAIHIHINFKSSFYVERAAETSGHAGCPSYADRVCNLRIPQFPKDSTVFPESSSVIHT